MKFLKIITLSTIFTLIFTYLAFLFVLPNLIDLNQYTPQIQKAIEDNAQTKTELSGVKIKTAWDLSFVVSADKISLKTTENKKFAQINKGKLHVSLIPLLQGEIKIDKIEAEKLLANIDESLLQTKAQKQSSKSVLQLAKKMPDISVDKYRISFLKGENQYTLKGADFVVSDFLLNEKIKLKSKGKLLLNKKEQIKYDLALFSTVFPEKKDKELNIFEFFESIDKYNLKAILYADLKLTEGKDSPDVKGAVSLDKLSFNFKGKSFPQSALKLDFAGNKAKINASLHLGEGSKALITGAFNTDTHKKIDLHITSDRVQIEDLFSLAKTISLPLGLKELDQISAKGLAKADFNIKSDMKNIESDGYLKIKNASVSHKAYKINMESINSEIDFSQNSIKIKKASALLNSQPITITGNVDKKAFANISIKAKDLNLKSVLFTLGQFNILKENEIKSGIVNLNVTLNGRLSKAKPKVNVLISNINLKNKKSNAIIKVEKISVNENAEISNIKISAKNQPSISVPKLRLNLSEKELNIANTFLYIDNIKANLSGKITNIQTTPTLSPIVISVPNQISVPIKGYEKSRIVAKGSISVTGAVSNPKISGNIYIPLISIPTMSTTLKNITLTAEKEIYLNCPYIKVANSTMNFSSKIDKDFSQGITVRNAKFQADTIDLNVLGGILKSLPTSGSAMTLNVVNGKNTLGIFKIGNIISSGITSDFTLKNNILSLNNLRGNAYFGQIAGNIKYHINNKKTELSLQGRGLSADLAMKALTGRDDDIHGKMDFDANASFIGHSRNELLRTLKGSTIFVIANGKMGMLGKFEHLIYAQNVLSNSIFRATLNLAAKAVTVKNTGVYRYMKGKISISNGWANIIAIKSSGPSMSLYITGRYSLLDDTANLTLLGRISDDVVNILGPIGEFSMNKVISSIPKLGEVSNSLIEQLTTGRNYENTSQIPPLSIQTHFPTKEFKVIIDGNTHSQSSVKSFKWLAKPKAARGLQQQPQQYQRSPQKRAAEVPDFVKNLPEFSH